MVLLHTASTHNLRLGSGGITSAKLELRESGPIDHSLAAALIGSLRRSREEVQSVTEDCRELLS